MDTDKSGTITREELTAKLKVDNELEKLLGITECAKLRQGITGGALMDSWTSMLSVRIDTSGDDVISWPEFENACFMFLAKTIFEAAAGSDGKLSHEELRAKLENDDEIEGLLGYDTTGLKLKAMITTDAWAGMLAMRIDESGDGMITWSEFETAIVEVMQHKYVEE